MANSVKISGRKVVVKADKRNRDIELHLAEMRGRKSMAESIMKLMTPAENIRLAKRVFKLARDNTEPS